MFSHPRMGEVTQAQCEITRQTNDSKLRCLCKCKETSSISAWYLKCLHFSLAVPRKEKNWSANQSFFCRQ